MSVAVTWNGERVVIKVSSHALCHASPVWKKFVHPPFPTISGDTNGPHVIDFTEDDSRVLFILFRIAHLQFKDIPLLLEYRDLLQMAVLCDQYDCIPLVIPWLKKWLENKYSESKKSGQEGWLFIAWVFGIEEVFQDLAGDMYLRSSISMSRELLLDGESLLEPTPPRFVGS